jgi:hypothetical protein
MNSGTGERLSAMPQPASASAPPNINAKDTKTRPTRRFYLVPGKKARCAHHSRRFGYQQLLKTAPGTKFRAASI